MASFKPPQQFITIVAVRVKPYKIFVAIQIRHNIIPIVGILWTPTKKTAITAQFFCSVSNNAKMVRQLMIKWL